MAERSRTQLVMLGRGLEGGTGKQQSRLLERGAWSWIPIGSPFLVSPAGSEIAGIPARLAPTVKRSQRYIWIGSLIFSPIGNAGVGVVGPSSRSTCENAAS